MTEVWATDGRDCFEAFQRHARAKHAWLRENGYENNLRDWPVVLRTDRGPYSLAQMRAEHPDHAARLLESFGLPIDWAPKPVRKRNHG